MNAADAWLAGVNGAEAGHPDAGGPANRDAPLYPRTRCPATNRPPPRWPRPVSRSAFPSSATRTSLVIQEGGCGEYKYFAPGVGEIRTEPRSSGGKQEIEELINLTQLSPRGLAELSAEALKLDKHAQVEAPDVFGHAPAAKRTL